MTGTKLVRPLLVGLGLLAVIVWVAGRRDTGAGGRPPLVVYCAHDSVYSEDILREFERRTGIPVSVRFDTEATKSLGLVNLLIQEKQHPRCDVFWNNELLGTLDLQEHGLLLPYKGAGYERIPSAFKDPGGDWTGFAARLRVWIVNTGRMPAEAEAIDAALAQDDLSRMAMARPLYGTTRTHYSVLWHAWGGARLRDWHHDVRNRGLREVTGNAHSMKVVAAGACDLGWTDTDDFFVARDDGRPVGMQPVRIDGGATVCIPNTVAIIRGTQRLDEARQLVDYLLSAETELALARSKARQVPLGPVEEAGLPDEVRQLKLWAQDGYDLTRLGTARRECLDWLRGSDKTGTGTLPKRPNATSSPSREPVSVLSEPRGSESSR